MIALYCPPANNLRRFDGLSMPLSRPVPGVITVGKRLDRMATLEMVPSFFSAHVFYWGDWHRDSVLGKERAYRISPAQSALQKGIPFSFHNDSPVVPPNMTFLMWNGVNRFSQSGDVLGPAQRVSPMDAIKAITYDPKKKTNTAAGLLKMMTETEQLIHVTLM